MAKPGDIVIGESGTAQFGFSDAHFAPGVKYITQIYFGSIGYSVPAAFGAAVAQAESEPGRPGRIILVVGDGSLQLTVQEIGTMVKLGLKNVLMYSVHHVHGHVFSFFVRAVLKYTNFRDIDSLLTIADTLLRGLSMVLRKVRPSSSGSTAQGQPNIDSGEPFQATTTSRRGTTSCSLVPSVQRMVSYTAAECIQRQSLRRSFQHGNTWSPARFSCWRL